MGIRPSNTGVVPRVPTHENKYIFMFSNKKYTKDIFILCGNIKKQN